MTAHSSDHPTAIVGRTGFAGLCPAPSLEADAIGWSTGAHWRDRIVATLDRTVQPGRRDTSGADCRKTPEKSRARLSAKVLDPLTRPVAA